MPKNPADMMRSRLARAVDWRVEAAIDRATADREQQLEQRLVSFRSELDATLEVLEATRRGLRVEDHAMIDRRLGLIDTRFNGIDDKIRAADKTSSATEKRLDELEAMMEAIRSDVGALRDIVRSQSVVGADQQRADVALLEQLSRRVRQLELAGQAGQPDAVVPRPASSDATHT